MLSDTCDIVLEFMEKASSIASTKTSTFSAAAATPASPKSMAFVEKVKKNVAIQPFLNNSSSGGGEISSTMDLVTDYYRSHNPESSTQSFPYVHIESTDQSNDIGKPLCSFDCGDDDPTEEIGERNHKLEKLLAKLEQRIPDSKVVAAVKQSPNETIVNTPTGAHDRAEK